MRFKFEMAEVLNSMGLDVQVRNQKQKKKQKEKRKENF